MTYFWADGDSEKIKKREFVYRYNDQNLLSTEIEWRFDFDRGWEYEDSTVYIYTDQGLLDKKKLHLVTRKRILSF